MVKWLTYLFLIFIASSVLAEDCSNYPYTSGIDTYENENGFRILSTGSTQIRGKSSTSLTIGMKRATMEAKANLVSMLDEELKSFCKKSDLTTEKTISIDGNTFFEKGNFSLEVCESNSSSRGLVKGITVLGDCYTPGVEVRVTVGISNETKRIASDLSGDSLISKEDQTDFNDHVAPDYNGSSDLTRYKDF